MQMQRFPEFIPSLTSSKATSRMSAFSQFPINKIIMCRHAGQAPLLQASYGRLQYALMKNAERVQEAIITDTSVHNLLTQATSTEPLLQVQRREAREESERKVGRSKLTSDEFRNQKHLKPHGAMLGNRTR